MRGAACAVAPRLEGVDGEGAVVFDVGVYRHGICGSREGGGGEDDEEVGKSWELGN